MEKEKKKYPIGAEHYTLYEEIGTGASALVHRALCNPLNEIVAIKILDFERGNCDLNNISREAQTMVLVDHPNVLRSHCSFVIDHNLWVVMPYMAGGSCLHILKASHPDGFEEVVIATVLREVLKGLEYLHQHGHIHRDVKAGNILIDTHGGIKLGDFGVSACLFDSGDRHRMRNTFVGTPCWMAPEVMEQLHGYDFKADIWSFGITALELAHGHAPFSKYPPMKVLLMTLQNAPPGLDYERDKKFSKSFKQMIASCLVKDVVLQGGIEIFCASQCAEFEVMVYMWNLERKFDDVLQIHNSHIEYQLMFYSRIVKEVHVSNNRLQDKFGTWRTDCNVIDSEIRILPFPATEESEPSAIFTLIFPAQTSFAVGRKRYVFPMVGFIEFTTSLHPRHLLLLGGRDMFFRCITESVGFLVLPCRNTGRNSVYIKNGRADSMFLDVIAKVGDLDIFQHFLIEKRELKLCRCLEGYTLSKHIFAFKHVRLQLRLLMRALSGFKVLFGFVQLQSLYTLHVIFSSTSFYYFLLFYSDKLQTQPQNFSSCNGSSIPQTVDDAQAEMISKANSEEIDEKAKRPVVQQKGRFKVTSENVDVEKVVPAPMLHKSHSMQVISQHPAISPPLLLDAPPSNPLVQALFPALQSVLHTNILQRDCILSLMKQISGCDSTAFSADATNPGVADKSLLEVAHDREKELLREITDLQWRFICAQDELQKYKTENGHINS
ncbi:uncharacterized protein LOC111406433 [Olea europaea var. sylvestris]|uniref:uncharacterized protein LOC111406433 n=1 Tax=Olea europaea var. sylvestris TaxID=158386 RepID=UPI000C1D7160|nr:uncharacterized protein LOC111406433 [Olea europaea var. sylvestris]